MTARTAKLPVRIYHYYQDHGDYWQINDKYNNYLAICKDAESAALLLRCCNSHEALVKACRVSLENHLIGECESQKQGKPRYCEVLEILRSALKLAEEE